MVDTCGTTRPQEPGRIPDDAFSHEKIMASLIRAREVAVARREAVEKAEREVQQGGKPAVEGPKG